MKPLVFFAFLLISFITNAQYPAYYIYGESQFKGIDIYDVIQDNDLNYWFATDVGLIQHDGYTYEKGICPEIKGSSVFGFVKDRNNIVYCYNLHHQVFKIENGKLELFYEIPSELAYHEIRLLIDQQDNLLIQGKGLIKISPDKSSTEVLSTSIFNDKTNPNNILLLPNGATISSSVKCNFVYQRNGKFKSIDLNKKDKIKSTYKWITFNNKVYAITKENLDVFELNTETLEFTFIKRLKASLAGQSLRLYVVKNELWIAGITNGCYVFDKDFNPKFNNNLLYKDKFISDIYIDHEENVLLSTFDDGVMIVPSNDVYGYVLPSEEKITRIASDNDSSVFLGSNVGNIYQYRNGDLKLIFSDRLKKGNEGISFWSANRILVYYTSEGAQFSKWDGKDLMNSYKCEGALKNVCFSNEKEALLAFNFGVVGATFDNSSENVDFDFKTYLCLKNRTYDIARDSRTRSIYSANSSGLIRLTENGDTTFLKHNNKVIYANAISYKNGNIVVGTKNNGLLIFNDDELVKEIPFSHGILKLKLQNNKIFFLTTEGLYVSDLNGTKIQRINNSTGLSCDNISDFHITNQTLYITNSEILQFIPLQKIFTKLEQIPLSFNTILVNDKAITNSTLESNQRKIQFTFSVNTLRYKDNIRYKYKLKGFDESWQYLNYDKNSVVYNALAPGEYTFTVQSINGDIASNTLQYEFKIKAPFHQTWWFFLLIGIFTFIIIGMFFMLRIKNIRKKDKAKLQLQQNKTDMLESELRALRSQMNPHFIFNSLNSIQDLILKEDTDASYDYIVLFADLVRNTLNYSNKDFIPLEKELEFLEVYLSLEKLRFKEDFEYSISADINMDIKVPSLLIQPFIENALLHGLIHKEGLKKLSILFQYDDNELICRIKDNGVGRERAREIQNRQGSHDSFALQAIEKRLSILNEQNEYKSGFNIIDLSDGQNSLGTEVILTLPYRKLY